MTWFKMRWFEVRKQAGWRWRLLKAALSTAPKCNSGKHKKTVGTFTMADDCDWAGESL